MSREEGTSYNPDMLLTIINSSEAGVYVADYNTGEILFANQKTAEFIGGRYTADELIGQTCWKALNEGFEERCEFCAYKKLIGENGELLPPYTWERHFVQLNAWAKITNQAIRWVDGRLAQITTFHDITEMKRMQELLAQHIRDEEQYKIQQNLQTLLDKLPVAIGITDLETTDLVYANQMFVNMFEYANTDALLGRSVLNLLPPIMEDGVQTKRRVQEILDLQGVNAFDMEFITSKGKRLDTRLTTCVLDYNNRTSSVGIVVDLAEENEQKRLLLQAAEREREANQLKSSFLSNMSHEIRTPLNAIMGMSAIIHKTAGDREKTLSSVQKLMSSSRHLLSIVNDVLDMAKIESGKFDLVYEPFMLKASLDDVNSIITQRCLEKDIYFLSNADNVPDFTLIGDKTRINQVLINLLGNAVKFTGAAGEIRFFIDILEESDRAVRLKYTVSDNGIGISQDKLPTLFQPYEQADKTTATRYGGTGLGLSISQNLVNMMGGTLRVTSELGNGSAFSFELLLSKGDPVTVPQFDRPEDLDLHGRRLLLVEDVAINREIICELLRDTGLAIDHAENGEIAVEQFRQSPAHHYGLIFMDVQMPVMGGYEATEKIRMLERADAKTIPIVAMTANAYKDDVDRALAVGMNGHLSKPIDIHAVARTLRRYFGSPPVSGGIGKGTPSV